MMSPMARRTSRSARSGGSGPLTYKAAGVDIEAGEIAHGERTHGHAEIDHRFFDGRAIHAVGGQKDRASQQAAQLAGHVKTGAVVDHDGNFFNGPGKGHGGGQGLIGGFLRADDLQQLHAVGRVKKVQPDHACGVFQHRSQLGDRQGRGVGGKNRIRPADAVELLPDALLDLHVFQHRFDDQVHVLQVVQGSRGRQLVLEHGFQLISRHLLFLDGIVECFAYSGHSFFQGRVIDFPQHGLESIFQQHADNARSHDPTAQHTDFLDPGRLDALNTRQSPGCPSIKKNTDQVFGHVRHHAVGKQVGFNFQIRIDVIAEPSFYGFHGLERSDIAFGLTGHHGLGKIDQGFFFGRTGQTVIAVAGGAQLDVQLSVNKFSGGLERSGFQLLRVYNIIDQSPLKTDFGLDGFADGDHFKPIAQSHQPRQPLGAPETRDDSEINFGLSKFSSISGINKVAGNGNFSSAAQGKSIYSGNYGNGQLLQLVDNGMPPGSKMFGLQGIESRQFSDIRASHKCFIPCTGEDKDPDILIGGNFIQRCRKFAEQRLVEGVERFGSVKCDGRNFVFYVVNNAFVCHFDLRFVSC